METTLEPAKENRIKSLLNKYKKPLWRGLRWATIGFFASTIFVVLLYSFVNPPVTPLMIIRYFEHRKASDRPVYITKNWVDIDDISPNMVLAVVSSEDNRFTEHWGLDLQAIEKAQKHNQRSKRKHGASTISQQVAKNVFLWPARTYVRKGLELYFTALIEVFWSKKRIMEVYLNVLETGKGMYGVEASARQYYGRPAKRLTRSQAAMIAAIIPSPQKRSPVRPTAYLYRRQAKILDLMGKIEKVDL